MSATDYAEEMLVDLAVHRWDLQRGADVGEAMDGAVVLHVLDYVRERIDSYAASGLFSAAGAHRLGVRPRPAARPRSAATRSGAPPPS